ncbi:MAG TPA: tetratricopeptide repeat protein [Acidobacteriaceae bacterium]
MTTRRILAACALLASLAAPRAFAVNKDMVQLQTQVQDLQNSVAHLQQTNDERMGVLKDLVQQTADSVNKMSTTVSGLEQQMRQQQEANGSKIEQVSGQMQSLNDSVDEVKARLNNLDKALQSLQSSQQSINATLQNMAPPQPATPDQNTPGAQPGTAAPGGAPPAGMQPMATTKPSPDVPFATQQGPYAGSRNAQPAQPSGAPVGQLFSTALSDYIGAKYSIAIDEFREVIQTNPSDQFAGQAWYYLGEIDYRQGKYSAAVKDYDHVLTEYPGSQKAAVSRLHKGQALLTLKDREAAIAEFRAIIQRFPNSPEAGQARSKLSGMGVSANARR